MVDKHNNFAIMEEDEGDEESEDETAGRSSIKTIRDSLRLSDAPGEMGADANANEVTLIIIPESLRNRISLYSNPPKSTPHPNPNPNPRPRPHPQPPTYILTHTSKIKFQSTRVVAMGDETYTQT